MGKPILLGLALASVAPIVIGFGALVIVNSKAADNECSLPTNLAVKAVFRECPTSPEMVVIPAGRFAPKDPTGFSQPFAMGKYPVTFEEWDACLGSGGCDGYRPDDEGWGRGRRPVINVSWHDAESYIAWLNAKVGSSLTDSPYHLPSELTWLYAGEAGVHTMRWWGDELGHGMANCAECGSEWGGVKTAPVGSFPPNPFGLYDILGNVDEWMMDCWSPGAQIHPEGKPDLAGDCALRPQRGGSWWSRGDAVNFAFRNADDIDQRSSMGGFRVVRDLPMQSVGLETNSEPYHPLQDRSR